MQGTSIYTWHDGRSRYDQVSWDPISVTRERARNLALQALLDDPAATRVHVDFGALEFVEAVRRGSDCAMIA
jgi:hypothetical protein